MMIQLINTEGLRLLTAYIPFSDTDDETLSFKVKLKMDFTYFWAGIRTVSYSNLCLLAITLYYRIQIQISSHQEPYLLYNSSRTACFLYLCSICI